MRRGFLFAVVVGALLVPCALSSQAPAGATGKCKDGTFTSAASKQGACRGHQGVDTWFAAAPDKAAAKEAASAKAPKSAAAPAQAATPAPAFGAAPAGATGKCKDGTFTSATTKQGACRGHQGIDTWYAAVPAREAAPAAAPASRPEPVAAPTPAPMPAPANTPARSSASDKAAAPGGGPGLVWVNTDSNVYHCYGTRWYGITKTGKYMSEPQATAAGARPDHGKPCSK